MRGAAGAGDDHPQAAAEVSPHVLFKVLRRAMGRDDFGFAADLKFSAHISGGFHGRPVRIAAHQNADERFGRSLRTHSARSVAAGGRSSTPNDGSTKIYL